MKWEAGSFFHRLQYNHIVLSASFFFLSVFPLLLLPPFFSFYLALSLFFLQTVLDVGPRSSRVSLYWRWRNSGTSVASDVGPATWCSPESISASECGKREQITFEAIQFSCLTQKRHTNWKHALLFLVLIKQTRLLSISSFSLYRLNCAFDTLK